MKCTARLVFFEADGFRIVLLCPLSCSPQDFVVPVSCRSEQRGVDANVSLPTQYSSYEKVCAFEVESLFESARNGEEWELGPI